jgi:hypothetical protein
VKSTRTFFALFFFLTTVGLGLVCLRLYRTNLALSTRLLDPKTGVQKELDDANATIKHLRDQVAALRADRRARVANGGPDEPGEPRPGGQNNRADRRAAFQALMESPQFQALRSIQEKVQLDSRYADLFKQFAQQYNLSPQQIDQFKGLLVARQQAQTDAAQAARQNGINPRSDPDAFQAAMNSATGDIDSQMKSDVGDAAYGAYQTFQQTAPQRQVVTQLQQSLSYSSVPLSDSQSQQLVSLLQQSGGGSGGNVGFGGVWGGGGPGGNGPPAQITNAEVTQAATFLNSSQVSALQQIQQAQQAQQQMGQLMRAQFRNGQNGGPRG